MAFRSQTIGSPITLVNQGTLLVFPNLVKAQSAVEGGAFPLNTAAKVADTGDTVVNNQGKATRVQDLSNATFFPTLADAQKAINQGSFSPGACAKLTESNNTILNYHGKAILLDDLPLIDGSLPIPYKVCGNAVAHGYFIQTQTIVNVPIIGALV